MPEVWLTTPVRQMRMRLIPVQRANRPEQPDGILMDVTGVPHLFGGEQRMMAEMRQRLAQYGFSVRIGQGATLGAAWALARYEAKEDRKSTRLNSSH